MSSPEQLREERKWQSLSKSAAGRTRVVAVQSKVRDGSGELRSPHRRHASTARKQSEEGEGACRESSTESDEHGENGRDEKHGAHRITTHTDPFPYRNE